VRWQSPGLNSGTRPGGRAPTVWLCPWFLCPQAKKQDPRVPAREPGYFSLNAKKSNQKKLCAARGISLACFMRYQLAPLAGTRSVLFFNERREPIDSALRNTPQQVDCHGSAKENYSYRAQVEGPAQATDESRPRLSTHQVIESRIAGNRNALRRRRPLFAYFLGAWRKSRSPGGASPAGFNLFKGRVPPSLG
jgi:hypothetical protein